MQALKDLQKRWDDTGRFRKLHASLALEREGVVLGANTILSRRDDDGALKTDNARVLTLLSVACGRPIDSSILHNFHHASKHARAGNEAMAAMHMALAGLPVLRDPVDDAKRLFIADGLMNEGVAPRDVWTALEFDPAPLDALEKFDQDQPRVPAGNPTGGQWTRDGAPSPAFLESPPTLAPPAPAPPIAPPTSAEASFAERALEIAGTAARATARAVVEYGPKVGERGFAPLVFLDTLFDHNPTEDIEGDIVGRPDLKWLRHQDETDVKIIRRSDNQIVAIIHPAGNGKFVDDNGRLVARWIGDKITVDPALFMSPKDKEEDRNLCPDPEKDRAGRPGTKGDPDRDYEDYVKSFVNKPPTDRGMAYQFYNPNNPAYPVHYDDCQRKTGVLVEAKGKTYSRLLSLKRQPSEGTIEKMLWQATNQVDASEGRPIIWFFAEEPAAEKARALFDKDPKLERIQVVYLPMPGWSR